MKNRIVCIITLCLSTLLSIFLFIGCGNSSENADYSLSSDGTYYTYVGKENGTETELSVKSEINGIPVTEIDEKAFSNNTALISVVIPNSVTKLGKSAFNNCTSLENVTLSDAIVRIPEKAFYQCKALKSITLPSGLLYIGKSSFYRCGLTSVSFPSSLIGIGEKAFYGNGDLTSVVLPDSLTKLDAEAFRNCSGITALTINKALTVISESSFRDCFGIETISFAMDGELEKINGSAFRECRKIQNLKFPNSLEEIGDAAFYNCLGLKRVEFGTGLRLIRGEMIHGEGMGAFGRSKKEDGTRDIIDEMIFPLTEGWVADHIDSAIGLSPSTHVYTSEQMGNPATAADLVCNKMSGYNWMRLAT